MDDDLKLADWSELLEDLLFLITDNLMNLEYIRFGAVCFEWRSFCIQNYEHIKLPSNLPLLMIPTPSSSSSHEEEEEDYNDDDDDNHEEEEQLLEEMPHDEVNFYYVDEEEEDEQEPPREEYYKRKGIWKGQDAETRHQTTRSFYSLSEGKVYQDFRLPVPYYKNCRGSSHGWLITVDEEEQPDGTYTYPVRLLNPFRSVNNQIQLPPLSTIPPRSYDDDDEPRPSSSFYLLKAFLSANPSSLSDLIVFGVYDNYRFGFCRPGDSAWTNFPLERQFKPIEDLICYKGRFLAIIQNGSVLEFDDFAHHHHLHPKLPPSVKFVARTPPNADNLTLKYLVESAGDLLQVQRNVIQQDGDDNCSTLGFRVFKLNAAANDDNDNEWVEMDNLDGRMLFLGDNNSISLSATDFPGCMPDCIYFTDDNLEYYDVGPGPSDFGMFNLVDKTFAWFYPMHMMPPPTWIQPML